MTEQEQIKTDVIESNISTLDEINYQMAELKKQKLLLEAELSDLINHDYEGEKTYTFGRYKVTVSSKPKYIINKEEYEAIGSRLPIEFNPVEVALSYKINKKKLDALESYGSSCDQDIACKIITKELSRTTIRKIGAAI